MAWRTAGRCAVLVVLSTGVVFGQDARSSGSEIPSSSSSSSSTITTAPSVATSRGPPPWVTGRDDDNDNDGDGRPPWVRDRDDAGPPPWVRWENRGQQSDDDDDQPPSWVGSSEPQEQQAATTTTTTPSRASTLSTIVRGMPTATSIPTGDPLPNTNLRNNQRGSGSNMSPMQPAEAKQTKRNVMIIIAVLLSTIFVTVGAMVGIVLMDRKHQRRVGFLRRRGRGSTDGGGNRSTMDEIEALKSAANIGGRGGGKIRAGRWTGYSRLDEGDDTRRTKEMTTSRPWYGKRGTGDGEVHGDGGHGKNDAAQAELDDRVRASVRWPSRALYTRSDQQEQHPQPHPLPPSRVAMEPGKPNPAAAAAAAVPTNNTSSRTSNGNDQYDKPLPPPRTLSRQSTLAVDPLSQY